MNIETKIKEILDLRSIVKEAKAKELDALRKADARLGDLVAKADELHLQGKIKYRAEYRQYLKESPCKILFMILDKEELADFLLTSSDSYVKEQMTLLKNAEADLREGISLNRAVSLISTLEYYCKHPSVAGKRTTYGTLPGTFRGGRSARCHHGEGDIH